MRRAIGQRGSLKNHLAAVSVIRPIDTSGSVGLQPLATYELAHQLPRSLCLHDGSSGPGGLLFECTARVTIRAEMETSFSMLQVGRFTSPIPCQFSEAFPAARARLHATILR